MQDAPPFLNSGGQIGAKMSNPEPLQFLGGKLVPLCDQRLIWSYFLVSLFTKRDSIKTIRELRVGLILKEGTLF